MVCGVKRMTSPRGGALLSLVGKRILQVELPASAQLFARRGMLVGLQGNAEHVSSSTSLLSPLKRMPLGIPFLYQKTQSTSPVSLLVSTPLKLSTLALLHLDGTQDWTITQRNAILAWIGPALFILPKVQKGTAIAYRSGSLVSGRGQLALAAKGECLYKSILQGQEYTVHPSHLLAYTSTEPPQLFQISFLSPAPLFRRVNLANFIPDIEFFRVLRNTDTWKGVSRASSSTYSYVSRIIWGNRAFLRFKGPASIWLQSNGFSYGEQQPDIGDSRARVEAIERVEKPSQEVKSPGKVSSPHKLKVASIVNGTWEIKDVNDFEAFEQR